MKKWPPFDRTLSESEILMAAMNDRYQHDWRIIPPTEWFGVQIEKVERDAA